MATPPAKRARPTKRAQPKEADPELAALLEEIKQTDMETEALLAKAGKVQRKLRSVS